MAKEEINKKKEYSTSEFRGVNTAALRQAIEKGQQSWLENIQPIGSANAKMVPNISSAILQLTGGRTPYYAQGFNIVISGTPKDILIVADTTGDVWAVDCNANALYPISYGTAYATKFKLTSACQWKNERIVFIDGTNGMYDWDGTTLTSSGGAAYHSPPGAGQCIASFSGRIWVSDNRTVYYTAPNDYGDFRTASDGGSIVITDETLHSSIQQLVASNNFLYIFGIDSCNVFSDVQVTSSGTVFTNTNLSTGVGTPFPLSVSTYYRSVWFAANTGFYAMYGAAARKESTELDGMYSLIQNIASPVANGVPPVISSGLVSINNILCIAFLFNYLDPAYANATPNYRPLLAIYFDKKWFFASQGSGSGVGSPTLIADCNVSGKNNLYAFDSSGYLYQLFSDTTTSVPFTWQTALWDFDQPVMFKQVTKVGVGVKFSALASSVNAYIDTEGQSTLNTLTTGSSLTFVGTGPITFTGAGSVPIYFLTAGYSLLQADCTNFGRYVGFTLSGNATQATFTLAMMEYNLRSQWGT